jgi:SAM-dependent methyltransferase
VADPALSRVDLYRALSDAGRLRLLALCSEEELTVSELSSVTGESQPQVSKKAAALRGLSLLAARKEGTRSFLRTRPTSDPVVLDALREGKRMCLEEGRLIRVQEVVRAREASSVAFFEGEESAARDSAPVAERAAEGPFLSHLAALGSLFGSRSLAVDVGSGEGHTLDVLAPIYDRVMAVDRSRARLARAATRVQDRGFANVSLVHGQFDDIAVIEEVDRAGGADLVFAGRVLHHAARPQHAVNAFARLLKPGGKLAILEYAPHDDEGMRESQADVWLGFSQAELRSLCDDAGLAVTDQQPILRALHPTGADAHLSWHTTLAEKH